MPFINCLPVRDKMIADAKKSNPGNLSLVIISVDGDKASEVYVRNKARTCEEVGIECRIWKYASTINRNELAKEIIIASLSDSVTGIILQLPLPDHLKPYERELLDLIPWHKDVDGLSSQNIGRLWSGLPGISPATPTGIMELLPRDLKGRTVTVINRSDLVGKPLIKMLLDRNATVTIAHSKSPALECITSASDIVISAIGKPKFFDKDYMLNGTLWIDCGINRDAGGKLCGDVDTDDIKDHKVLVTPVPGGVGILTTAQLMLNVIKAHELQKELNL